MNYFYCDSCFLITCFQEGYLDALSQYKDCFYISDSQIKYELIKPDNLASEVRKAVTVVFEREEIILKALEFTNEYRMLSYFDCLSMAFSLLDGYCLVTDDKNLIKKCNLNNIPTKTSIDIVEMFMNKTMNMSQEELIEKIKEGEKEDTDSMPDYNPNENW